MKISLQPISLNKNNVNKQNNNSTQTFGMKIIPNPALQKRFNGINNIFENLDVLQDLIEVYPEDVSPNISFKLPGDYTITQSISEALNRYNESGLNHAPSVLNPEKLENPLELLNYGKDEAGTYLLFKDKETQAIESGCHKYIPKIGETFDQIFTNVNEIFRSKRKPIEKIAVELKKEAKTLRKKLDDKQIQILETYSRKLNSIKQEKNPNYDKELKSFKQKHTKDEYITALYENVFGSLEKAGLGINLPCR